MKRLILIFFLFIVVLFTVIVFYNNKLMAFNNDRRDIVVLKDHFLNQINQMKLNINDSISFRDTSGNKIGLSQITNGTRLGIYMDTYGCDMCSKEAIEYVRKKIGISPTIPAPFIIANSNNSNPRDLKLFSRKIPFPLYSIDVRLDKNMMYLSELHKPFYFLLETNGTMSSVFFAQEDINLVFRDDYFAKILNKISIKDAAKSLNIVPKDMDLGEIKIRKKYNITFTIENNTTTNCWITSIKSYCGCITSHKKDNYAIAPGKVDTVTASIVLTDEGQFSRQILLETNYRKEPYIFTVSGTVVGQSQAVL